MEIIEKKLSTKAIEQNDFRNEYTIVVNGKTRINVGDYGEPEDNSLGRDLDFVYDIVKLMKDAYNAGKNGENFNVIQKEMKKSEW